MLFRRYLKQSCRKWFLPLLMASLIIILMWIAPGSRYACQDDKDIYNSALIHDGTTARTESWDNGILLGGHPKSEKVFLTIGIPTVRRQNGTYLFSTLESLINGSSETERQNTTIVISVNDHDAAFTSDLMSRIRAKFDIYLNGGFIQVINPPMTYYPSLMSLKKTFGDDQHRVRWRSKQNLDYAFLIHYSQNLSQYYLQLEDDVITSPGYISKMASYVSKLTDTWTMIDFSEMGFIGKLYKSSDLPKLANLLRVFFNEQPCDFLLLHFLNLMLQRKRYMRIPTLFKHIGYYSSLHNQTRHSSNAFFFEGQTKKYKGDNPPAILHTTIRDYDNYRIEMAYNNSESGGFFWGKTPKAGDTISIIFDQPHNVTRVVIATGLAADPEKDRIRGAILKYGRAIVDNSKPTLCGADVYLGKIEKAEFDYNDEKLLNVKCIELLITENYTQWLFLKEIAIFVK